MGDPAQDRIARLEDAVERLERTVIDLQGAAHWLVRRQPNLREWARTRVRDATSPRLGVLRQHAPRRLTVPRDYLSVPPPQPAPSICVVTPSLDQARYLERTLCSVLCQDYPALEYVVQDGGSEDGSAELLEAYGPRLARWTSEADDGQADAVNRGFADSGCEIMAYVNSDDMLLPGTLATVARHMAENPDVDVLYGHRLVVDEADRVVGSWVMPEHDDEMLRWLDFIPQESLFWRREAWERAGGQMNADLHYALDWDLLLRLQASGARIERLPRFLGAFRIHPIQKTTSALRLGERECRRIREELHGGPVDWDAAEAVTRAYTRRHLSLHARHVLKTTLSRGDRVDAMEVIRSAAEPRRGRPGARVPALETT